MKTSGNTILITGGGSGIGLALAKAFFERGNDVIICGRRKAQLKEAQTRIGGINFRVCDLSKARSRQALGNWIVLEFKQLNVLVNNAGIQHRIDFLRGTRDLPAADDEIATNLTAPIHLTAQLLSHLKRKKAAAIINISSGLAFTPIAAVPVYCATKAALHSWSLSLRHQLRHTSIRVFEVVLPMVATELSGNRNSRNDIDYVMSPEVVANGIIRAIGRNQHEVALGAAANLRAQREKLFSAINQ